MEYYNLWYFIKHYSKIKIELIILKSMARYRRYYRRYVRAAKKKWASNTTEIDIAYVTVPAGSFYATGQGILQNGDRINTSAGGIKSTAQILKCSRIRFRGTITTSISAGVSLLYFITYVPEGAVTLFTGSGTKETLGNYGFYAHPEWVMAWGRKDYSNTTQNNDISLTTKLKRNLNSGDSIFLIICWINQSVNSVTSASVTGTISYMCCAN